MKEKNLRKAPKRARPEVPRVLVVGPSPTAHGGIATVVSRHQSTAAWSRFRCRLLQTVCGGNTFVKLCSAVRAWMQAPSAILCADLVHFHLAAGRSAARKLPIIWMAAAMHRKVILHFHCAGAASLFESTPQWIQESLRSRADLVVVLSPYWQREFERRWPEMPTAVLQNPAPETEPSDSEREVEILFVGELTKRKGYDQLLEAMPEVLRSFPLAQLWMAGEGELQQAKRMVRSLGLFGSVRLLGWVASERLQELYSGARILCLPSFAEGVPMVVLEAMAAGVAVITTPVGGIPDLVVDGENGIFVPAGNSIAISEALLGLLRSPEEIRRLGQAAQRTVRERNSIARVSELLDKIYSGLHQSRGVTGPTRSVSASYPG